jgi:hypothetical protein
MMIQVQKALLALAATELTIHHPLSVVAQQQHRNTPEQCTSWVNAAIASDTNQSASGGLDPTEFMNFLSSLPELKPYFESNGSSFADTPFKVQLAYPTLACWCVKLGEGEGCCMGPDPKIIVSALVNEESQVTLQYREDFCSYIQLVVTALSTETTTTTTLTNSSSSSPSGPITFNIIGSVIDYSTYPYEQIFNNTPVDELPSFSDAADIMADSASRQGVIGNLLQGFTRLSLDSLEKCPVMMAEGGALVAEPNVTEGSKVVNDTNTTNTTATTTLVLQPGLLGSLNETLVNDISKCYFVYEKVNGNVHFTCFSFFHRLSYLPRRFSLLSCTSSLTSYIECPGGLSYAPQDAFCVEFVVTMKPSEELAKYEGVRKCLVDNINEAIQKGLLYSIISEIYPKTMITGLGAPGAGVDYKNTTETPSENNTSDDNASSSGGGGLSGGMIALIILALLAVPLCVLALVKRRSEEGLVRDADFAEKPAKDTDLENTPPPAVVPAPLPKNVDVEEEKQEEDENSSVWSESKGSQRETTVDEDAKPVSKLGSSLAAMGVASAVATNLYEKKSTTRQEEQEKKDLKAIKAEIGLLVDKTAPGKTSEELLAAYEGKEEELLSHLRRLDRETSRS